MEELGVISNFEVTSVRTEGLKNRKERNKSRPRPVDEEMRMGEAKKKVKLSNGE